MYKKRDLRAKLLFCQNKPFSFLLFSLMSPSSLPKLPTVVFPEWCVFCFLDVDSCILSALVAVSHRVYLV